MSTRPATGLYSIRLLRGEHAIAGARSLTVTLAERFGQAEAVHDLHYYLRKPGLLKRTPVLLLVSHANAPRDIASMRTDDLIGTVLLFEYSALRLRAGMYTSNDRSGRRTIISAPENRSMVAECASRYLLENGANVVMLSYRSEEQIQPGADGSQNEEGSSWVTRERSIPDFLPIRRTFDETLAQIGKRTRTHMRYYRRRAEAELNCRFDPVANISAEELRAFNQECMFPLRDPVVSWRLRSVMEFTDPILMSLRDQDGRLLSVLGGRRQNGDAEIFWQMNTRRLPANSLSLVMRTYFIEHESERGTKRLYLDGGTSHSLCHSFVPAVVTDLAVMRHSLLVTAARKFARRLIPPDNELAHLLARDAAAAASPVRYESRAA